MAVIIPAIDVLDGQCVRLTRGRRDAVTVYDPDPALVAHRFATAGARRLHLVDLGGAFGAGHSALPVLRKIVAQTGLPVQYGGGLRTADDLRAALDAGASWVITGTAALADPAFLGRAAAVLGDLDHVILAIDLRDGRPLVEGWQAEAGMELPAVLGMARRAGVTTVMVTDTAADGTMAGAETEVFGPAMGEGFRVLVAGGIAALTDIRRLTARWASGGLDGIVVGSALLKGAFTLAQAQQAAGDPATA